MTEEMLDGGRMSREQFSFQICLESGELFVTEHIEFQTAGATMLNALDWKLICVAN